MITKKTDDELREEGVPEDLLEQRRYLNTKIKVQGEVKYWDVIKDCYIECIYAFISNPHGYPKVFLQTKDGGILEHFDLSKGVLRT